MIPLPGSRRVARCAPRDLAGAGQERSYVVDVVREHGGRLLVRLDGVADRDAADALRGSVVRRRLRRPAADRRARHVLRPPARRPARPHDGGTGRRRRRRGAAHRCRRIAGGAARRRRAKAGEVLVPFVSAIVTSVSLDDGMVEIDPPEGLLDLE